MNMVNKGKKMIIILIVTVLLIEITLIAILSSFYAAHGRLELASFKLLQGIFRLMLTGLILFFLYKGHRWAKTLLIILFISGGLISLLSLVSNFNIISLALGLVYVLFSVMMIVSKNVNVFLEYQRGEFVPDLDENILRDSKDSFDI